MVRFSLKQLFTVTTFVALAIVIGIGINRFVYRPYLRARGVSANAATSQQANIWIWPNLRIPASASDVSYVTDAFGCEVKFAISERAFLDWCKGKNWKVEEITTPIPFFEGIISSEDNRQVTDGYKFSPPDGAGVFDKARSRAAFWVSEFP